LDNDKAFAAFALILLVGVVSVISTVVLTGPGTWPTPLHLAEHVALGLSMRFAYKWIGGFDSADWSVASDRVRETAEMVPTGATADAMS
jgi:hypothetical protein